MLGIVGLPGRPEQRGREHLTSFCRKGQNSTVESAFRAFFGIKFYLPVGGTMSLIRAMIRRYTEQPANAVRCWMGSGASGLRPAVLGPPS